MGIKNAQAKAATGKKKRNVHSTSSATNSKPKKKKQRSATDHVEMDTEEKDSVLDVGDTSKSSDSEDDQDNAENHAAKDTKNLQLQMEKLTRQLEEVQEKYTTQQAELQELRKVKPKNGEKRVKEAVRLTYAQMKRSSEFIHDDLFHDIKIVDPRFNSADSDVM